MKVIENVSYCGVNDSNRVLNIYLPEADEFPVFVYFHGGGLENGSHEFELLGRSLTDRGIALVSAQYRMYPTAKYPDFLEDAAAAVNWTCKNINSYGRCDEIYIGGSSAGGYISMMLCFDDRWLSLYGISPESFAGFIHDAGQPTVHFNVLREQNLDTKRVIVDEKAPLYHIGNAKEYAPMLFIVSDNDIENRYEQSLLVLSTLKHFQYDQSKIEFKKMHGDHCHYVGQKDENGDSVFGKIIYDFIMKEQKNEL